MGVQLYLDVDDPHALPYVNPVQVEQHRPVRRGRVKDKVGTDVLDELSATQLNLLAYQLHGLGFGFGLWFGFGFGFGFGSGSGLGF